MFAVRYEHHLTDSVELSTTREATSCAATQQLICYIQVHTVMIPNNFIDVWF
jgi:hypothetical protein